MMSESQPTTNRLSEIQSQAVNWDDGAALVLAGPGVDKTRVLTERIARILRSTPDKRFRVLALTYTNRTGDVMRDYVEQLVPDLIDRAVIGTFHSFCERLLRLHGTHLGFKSDFRIYSQDSDREEIFRDALRAQSAHDVNVSHEDVRWLKMIDRLRRSLVSPQDAVAKFSDRETGEHVARVYRVYGNALRECNAMDPDELIFNTHRLVTKLPALANRIQRSYRYWMIDEFQDTAPAQFTLIRSLAKDNFKNVFVVADDDQLIYQCTGASYQQILDFCKMFSPHLIQMVEDPRCPADIVEASNYLISHNFHRTRTMPVLSAEPSDTRKSITVRRFETDREEAEAIAKTLADRRETWGQTAILARQRWLLDLVEESLGAVGVKSNFVGGRDQFASPQFVWLESCLCLSVLQMSRRALASLVAAGNRIAGSDDPFDAEAVSIEAIATDKSFLEFWADLAVRSGDPTLTQLARFAKCLINSRRDWRGIVREVVEWLPSTVSSDGEGDRDVDGDRLAWQNAEGEIHRQFGGQIELDEFFQAVSLRSKEPWRDPGSACLSTIHGSMGLEFDYVWVMGVADSILPSWQSLTPDASPIQLEQERRSFFDAITRTRKRLALSYANRYGGRTRDPSRFLRELEIRHPKA